MQQSTQAVAKPGTFVLIKLPLLKEIVTLSRSAIYDRMDSRSPRHDPTFPQPIRLGDGNSVAWVLHEVEAWLAAQVAARDSKRAA